MWLNASTCSHESACCFAARSSRSAGNSRTLLQRMMSRALRDQLVSWVNTAVKVAEAWRQRAVPAAYAIRTLRTAKRHLTDQVQSAHAANAMMRDIVSARDAVRAVRAAVERE